MTNIVTRKSITFINNQTPATITESSLDLDTCYKETEIVIEVYAAALNPVDLGFQKLTFAKISNSKPKGIGEDYSGVIIRKGVKVAPIWGIGDQINGLYTHFYGEQGTLSNYLILDPSQHPAIGHIVSKSTPATINEEIDVDDDDDDGNGKKKNSEFVKNAAWPVVFGTAYQSLFGQGQIWNKDSMVLVFGASTSVANCFVQIAKNQLHIGTVIGICSSKSMEQNQQVGFDYTIPYDEGEGFIANLRDLMKTPEFIGKKFDLIFDSAGTSEFYPVMDEFLKPRVENSYYVTAVGPRTPVEYTPKEILSLYSLSAPIRTYNPWRKFNYKGIFGTPNKSYMDLAARMISLGRYVPKIDSVYQFEKFEEAFDKLRSGKAKGKIVIQIKE
ncbi:uncharacterized protein NDAI_0C01140 [Naumovozyma dairenensis CBS 421]|uniref:Enoyl reductase (ER) domain-containing protein n=1 Tax=Naumovozyma dairenensis (strain ATCC 10597 / BCRC 20456 / CBS 421 / NBRC 0211 / NRRL Y-12639) TaxID=1071378 RepID=G0W7L4_NAUDC|nr:hypothetical protein NDAI_0C01140 [Naumovozyma dairenensis CBS 421]CCD23775.1 hypothetical protein NDAI_0C01140 [Naumovozyma dairenensis CBS 421]